MLQKPQTKFGYARRIFALPVLFTIAFAYMVNAKNKEITETNIEISKAVSEIKKDTVRPDVKIYSDKIESPRIIKKSDEQKKIADLGKKIQEKSKALKELKPESKEFQKNLDEINSLSNEIGKITSSEDFLKSGMTMRIDGKEMNMNDFFKSDEWNGKLKELKKMNIEMPELSEFDFDFPESFPSAPNAPNAPNAPQVKIFKFKGDSDFKWSPEMESEFRKNYADKAKGSALSAKKRAELDRKRAKLNEKRAKLEGERAKLEAERRVLEGDRRVYIYGNNMNFNTPNIKKRISLRTSDGLKAGENGYVKIIGANKLDENNMKIYINGKEVTKQDMESLIPDNIKSMNVNKRNSDGKTAGEIRIETKK